MRFRKAPSDEEKRQKIEALYARSKPHFADTPEITVAELERLRNEAEIQLVDVRSPQEQEVSMLPGAVTATEFEADPARFDGRTIVTYCTIGHRSGLYAQRLRAQGIQAFNLKGAILAWTHGGGDLRDARGPTRRVHVCGPRWNLAAEAYEPVW